MTTNPIYKTNLGKLYCADCLDIMKEMPTGSIDLCATDSPYNVGLDYGNTTDDNRKDKEYADWMLERLAEMRRVAKTVAITPGVGNMYIYPKPDWIACWYKHGSPSRCPVGFNAWEPILIWGKRKAIERTDVFDAVIESHRAAEGHPCPKPIKLFKEIIHHYTEKDDLVMDCFLGSGTTAIAAEQLERKWVGIEINREFCDLIIERLKKWNGQTRLI